MRKEHERILQVVKIVDDLKNKDDRSGDAFFDLEKLTKKDFFYRYDHYAEVFRCAEGLGPVIDMMKNNQSSKKIQRAGCLILSNLAQASDALRQMIIADGLEVILNTREMHTSMDARLRVIEGLLCTSTGTESTILHNERVLKVIVNDISDNTDGEFLKKACVVLGRFVWYDALNCKLVGSLGGVETIVRAMERCTELDVQIHCCKLLMFLPFGDDEYSPNRALVDAAGGIEAVVRAMERYPNKPVLLEAAMRALGNFADRERNYARRIVDVGGLCLMCVAYSTLMRWQDPRQFIPAVAGPQSIHNAFNPFLYNAEYYSPCRLRCPFSSPAITLPSCYSNMDREPWRRIDEMATTISEKYIEVCRSADVHIAGTLWYIFFALKCAAPGLYNIDGVLRLVLRFLFRGDGRSFQILRTRYIRHLDSLSKRAQEDQYDYYDWRASKKRKKYA